MTNMKLTKNVRIFEESMNYISDNLQKEVDHSIENSIIYFDYDWPWFDEEDKRSEFSVVISKDRSFSTAMKYRKDNPDKKIAVLNFANAFHAGGGVKKGCTAQEESLCRISTLYPVISSDKMSEFYTWNRNMDFTLGFRATDALIYSEDVTIFKSDTDDPQILKKEDQVKVDVITMAAPDLREYSMQEQELFSIHINRALHMLTCAAGNGVDILILGALGCGAFKNDPVIVAKAWKNAIRIFPKVFDKVEFAIYGKNSNYQIFKTIFEEGETLYDD